MEESHFWFFALVFSLWMTVVSTVMDW